MKRFMKNLAAFSNTFQVAMASWALPDSQNVAPARLIHGREIPKGSDCL